MLQPGRYFADVCRHLGLEHLLDDERFGTAEGLMANAAEVGQHVAEAIAKQPYAYWVEHLQTMEGQWAPVQDPLEVVADPQMRGQRLPPRRHRRRRQRRGSSWPTRCSSTRRRRRSPAAPQFAEHTDEILRELGKDEDEIIQLKIDGACT